MGTAIVPRNSASSVPWYPRRRCRLLSEAGEEMGALNTHEEREREIEALRASISRLSAANLRINESPDIETVLHETIELLRQGVPQHLGGFPSGTAAGLRLGHDHASQFLSEDFQNELAFPGIESSTPVAR